MLARVPGIESKKMFGGIGFMLNDNMACGILNDMPIVLVGLGKYRETPVTPHCREFDITGKSMIGLVMVERPGLAAWVRPDGNFSRSLPLKQGHVNK